MQYEYEYHGTPYHGPVNNSYRHCVGLQKTRFNNWTLRTVECSETRFPMNGYICEYKCGMQWPTPSPRTNISSITAADTGCEDITLTTSGSSLTTVSTSTGAENCNVLSSIDHCYPIPGRNSCLKLEHSNQSSNWFSSASACERDGGRLLWLFHQNVKTFMSFNTATMVRNFCPSCTFLWIGLMQSTFHDDNFFWKRTQNETQQQCKDPPSSVICAVNATRKECDMLGCCFNNSGCFYADNVTVDREHEYHEMNRVNNSSPGYRRCVGLHKPSSTAPWTPSVYDCSEKITDIHGYFCEYKCGNDWPVPPPYVTTKFPRTTTASKPISSTTIKKSTSTKLPNTMLSSASSKTSSVQHQTSVTTAYNSSMINNSTSPKATITTTLNSSVATMSNITTTLNLTSSTPATADKNTNTSIKSTTSNISSMSPPLNNFTATLNVTSGTPAIAGITTATSGKSFTSTISSRSPALNNITTTLNMTSDTPSIAGMTTTTPIKLFTSTISSRSPALSNITTTLNVTSGTPAFTGIPTTTPTKSLASTSLRSRALSSITKIFKMTSSSPTLAGVTTSTSTKPSTTTMSPRSSALKTTIYISQATSTISRLTTLISNPASLTNSRLSYASTVSSSHITTAALTRTTNTQTIEPITTTISHISTTSNATLSTPTFTTTTVLQSATANTKQHVITNATAALTNTTTVKIAFTAATARSMSTFNSTSHNYSPTFHETSTKIPRVTLSQNATNTSHSHSVTSSLVYSFTNGSIATKQLRNTTLPPDTIVVSAPASPKINQISQGTIHKSGSTSKKNIGKINKENGTGGKLSSGAIVGISVAAVLVVIVLSITAIICIRYFSKTRIGTESPSPGISMSQTHDINIAFNAVREQDKVFEIKDRDSNMLTLST